MLPCEHHEICLCCFVEYLILETIDDIFQHDIFPLSSQRIPFAQIFCQYQCCFWAAKTECHFLQQNYSHSKSECFFFPFMSIFFLLTCSSWCWYLSCIRLSVISWNRVILIESANVICYPPCPFFFHLTRSSLDVPSVLHQWIFWAVYGWVSFLATELFS